MPKDSVSFLADMTMMVRHDDDRFIELNVMIDGRAEWLSSLIVHHMSNLIGI